MLILEGYYLMKSRRVFLCELVGLLLVAVVAVVILVEDVNCGVESRQS